MKQDVALDPDRVLAVLSLKERAPAIPLLRPETAGRGLGPRAA